MSQQSMLWNSTIGKKTIILSRYNYSYKLERNTYHIYIKFMFYSEFSGYFLLLFRFMSHNVFAKKNCTKRRFFALLYLNFCMLFIYDAM